MKMRWKDERDRMMVNMSERESGSKWQGPPLHVLNNG